jgi:hypothetical protein
MKFIHSGRGYAMGYEVARRTPRYSFIVDVELTDVMLQAQIKARTRTLSPIGCGVDTSKLFVKGTIVRIKLSHLGAEVCALGRVVYARSGLGMGVTFTSVDRENERILEWWIAEYLSVPIQK